MKTKTYNETEISIEFNDNNMEHVLAGPDYGQPWGDWNGWEDLDGGYYIEPRGLEENITVGV